jgi:hypothetical protein
MKLNLSNQRKWILAASAAVLLVATPSFALFGIGDIVFDPTSYASLVSQLTTLENQYRMLQNNLSLRSGANDIELIALSEIVGVRLLLVNVLRSLGTGQRMTAEAFDKLVNEIGGTKYDLAAKLIAERRR